MIPPKTYDELLEIVDGIIKGDIFSSLHLSAIECPEAFPKVFRSALISISPEDAKEVALMYEHVDKATGKTYRNICPTFLTHQLLNKMDAKIVLDELNKRIKEEPSMDEKEVYHVNKLCNLFKHILKRKDED